MKTIKTLTLLTLMMGCKDQLDIVNPNQPTPASASTEQGIISLAQGALYINGFQTNKFGGNYFATVLAYHELMGDVVGSPVANYNWNLISCPDKIVLDNSELQSVNANGQISFLKEQNIPTIQGNPFYYEWAFMYSLNNAMNNVLSQIDIVPISEDQKNTLKTWAYYWKGFAYSRIGSMYIAGLIIDEANKTNNLFLTKEVILLEAETNLARAEQLLRSISNQAEFVQLLDSLIPSVCKPGKGGTLSIDEWIRNINTLRARNILVNAPAAALSVAQWNQILDLTTNGIGAADNTFTVRTDAQGNLLGSGGHVAAGCIGADADGGGRNKVSERLIQDFKPGDNRLSNNFKLVNTWLGPPGRGTAFNTRYVLVNKGNGMPGVVVMCDRTVGAHELYIAGSYEENILMQAEANIYLGNIDAGLALIDELRTYQGASLAPVASTGLTIDQAKEELRRERRVALAFRGFAFYDARRWGVLENGRTGSVVVDFDGTVYTSANIDYGYLDYWDVPIAELFYNPQSSDSAPVVNPKN